MRRFWHFAVFALVALGAAMLPAHSARAELEDSAEYGFCVTHLPAEGDKFYGDPSLVVYGNTDPGIATNHGNGRGHWHFKWTAEKGQPVPQPGQCVRAIFDRQVDGTGEHHYVREFYLTDVDTAMNQDDYLDNYLPKNSNGTSNRSAGEDKSY